MESERDEESQRSSHELRSSASFVLIGNIPGQFHSSDLRAFFSHFIEKKGFVCFHFRHRPELLAERAAGSAGGEGEGPRDEASVGPRAPKSCCCVVAVVRGLERELRRLYLGKNWAHPNGELLRARVRISDLAILSPREPDKGSDSFMR